MTQPNFLIIGAQKCGTTTMHATLRRHPDVFMSEVKELEFFNHQKCMDDDSFERDYLPHFADAAGHAVVGESTATCFWTHDPNSPWCRQSRTFNPDIPEAVLHRLGPDMRFLVILRDPVQRAISAYFHHFRNGRIRGKRNSIWDFGAARGIVDMGFYHRHLARWQQVYPPERFLVFVHEELFADFDAHLRRLFEFLRLHWAPCPLESRNVMHGVQVTDQGLTLDEKTLEGIRIRRPRIPKKKLPIFAPLISWDDCKRLQQLYSEDMAALERRLGRSLAVWRDKEFGPDTRREPRGGLFGVLQRLRGGRGD